ncbi:MAG: fibronectin type III domain-containing protein, partial [Chloroflexi bacterium]
ADNGSDWFFQGTEDPGWNTAAYDTMVSQLKTVPASAFEAIDESALMVNPNSAQAGTVPAQPAAPSAAPGNGRAIVTWSPPANGGQPITGYTITGTPGGTAVAGGTATAAIVFGLANGTSYTFTVTARNVVGTGPPSPPSNPVVPNSRLVAPSSPAPSGGRPPVTQVPPQPPPPRIVWLQPGARLEG